MIALWGNTTGKVCKEFLSVFCTPCLKVLWKNYFTFTSVCLSLTMIFVCDISDDRQLGISHTRSPRWGTPRSRSTCCWMGRWTSGSCKPRPGCSQAKAKQTLRLEKVTEFFCYFCSPLFYFVDLIRKMFVVCFFRWHSTFIPIKKFSNAPD